MERRINRVKEIDVLAIGWNKTLAAGADRSAIERCKDAVEKLGVLHTPVVGVLKSGRRIILSGQSELMAVRELGAKKVEAVEVDVPGDERGIAKLALVLMSLREAPGALCEGLLLREAADAGVPRPELQAILGRSASWVSNRISLVTRLDGGVFGMVNGGLLEPRSAQEIARLPAEAQFAFAEMALRERLPKSAIEGLVALYNDEGCPEAVRKQILGAPRQALRRAADKRRAVGATKPEGIGGRVDMLIAQVRLLCRTLFEETQFEADKHARALRELEAELAALLAIVKRFVSPGKKEEAKNAG